MKALLILLLSLPASAAISPITSPGSSLASGAVDTDKLATDSVTAAKILNATITGAKLAANLIYNGLFSIRVSADDGSQGFTLRAADNTSLGGIFSSSSGMDIIMRDISGNISNRLFAGNGNTFNEQGDAMDFRVESDNNANMLKVNGAADTVTIGGSTMTVANTGNVSAPSQAGVSLQFDAHQTILPTADWTPIYWGSEAYDHQQMHSVSIASATVTIPVNGTYLVAFKAGGNTNGDTFRIAKNGADFSPSRGGTNQTSAGVSIIFTDEFTAGTTLRVDVYQGDITLYQSEAMFSVQKLW